MSEFSDADLRLLGLVQGLLSLSEDAVDEYAGVIKLYGPTGTLVGEVKLSDREINVLTETVTGLGNTLRLWEPKTNALPEVDGDDTEAWLKQAEAFANEEQL
jgi:hypothetical protein